MTPLTEVRSRLSEIVDEVTSTGRRSRSPATDDP